MSVTIHEIIAKGQEVAKPDNVAVSEEAMESIPTGAIAIQQGDIYLRKLGCVPKGALPLAGATGQLAPGTSQGSRHCVDSAVVRLYAFPGGGVLNGPVIEAKERFTVTHPEHGDVTLPAGVYHVTYQRAYADEMRRVID